MGILDRLRGKNSVSAADNDTAVGGKEPEDAASKIERLSLDEAREYFDFASVGIVGILSALWE